jgi:adenylate kinase family enzyme
MAVVILGESMAGKSTLVAELCAREGFEMLADDTVFIEERSDGFYVLPTETTHSLREDAARHFGAATRNLQKTHLPAATFASGPAKLRAFVSLIFDGCQTICPIARALHGSEMFNVLNSAFFRFVIDEDEVTRRDFSQMAALGAAVPFFELRRRPSLDLLQASARTLRTCLPQVAAQPSGRCEDA